MTATWYANYSFGPVSVGYQTGGLDYGLTTAAKLLLLQKQLLLLVVTLNLKKCQLRLT